MLTIVYLNRDAFVVNRVDYLKVVEETQGDWIKVSEWVEVHGTFISRPTRTLPLPF